MMMVVFFLRAISGALGEGSSGSTIPHLRLRLLCLLCFCQLCRLLEDKVDKDSRQRAGWRRPGSEASLS